MPNPDGTLTDKEQKVIAEYERARRGYGAIANGRKSWGSRGRGGASWSVAI